VNCLAVRELLPELAVGALSPGDREQVDRHLRWCAGCRKESSDLGQAAATIALALDPAPVPGGLDDRIVERIRRSVGRRGTPRRIRTTVAALVAATVAVASLGWGAVMAGRADRLEERARDAETRQAAAIERFAEELDRIQRLFPQILPVEELPTQETHLGQLSPASGSLGGGAVLQLVSPTTIDFTIVIVNGLDPRAADRLPYRIQLFDADGEMLRAGRIDELDADGGAQVFRQYANTDLTGFTTVRVVDASGAEVLSGVVDQG
jgi:hypothetical protein